MSFFIGSPVSQCFICSDVMDIGDPFYTICPNKFWSSSSIQDCLGMIFDPFDSLVFCRILMWMMGFCESIFDTELSANGGEIITGLHFGIVPSEKGRTSFFPQKMFICYWAMTFGFHGVDIDHSTLDSIEDLGTCISSKGLTVCKEGISGNWFISR